MEKTKEEIIKAIEFEKHNLQLGYNEQSQFYNKGLERAIGVIKTFPELNATPCQCTALREALEKIVSMKREQGETNDTYVFNRCWHIATEALASNKEV